MERQPLLFSEVYLCENAQAAGSEVMSGLSGCTVTRKGTVLVLFTGLVSLSLNVWEVSPMNKMENKKAQQESGHGIYRPL